MRIVLFRKAYKTLSAYYSSSSATSLKIDGTYKQSKINDDNYYDYLVQFVTPLANIEYSEQLKIKQDFSKTIIQNIYKPKSIPKFKSVISDIIPSPVTEGYRNKDEFSVNTGIDGNPKTVGFYVGPPSNGKVLCVNPTGLINTKMRHKEISQMYEEFIRSSPLRACLLLHDGGFWRNLIVRSNMKGETMVSVIVHPHGASKEVMDEAIQQFTDFFSSQNITSLYYQVCPHTRCSNSVAPFTLLHGNKYLYEQLGPYKFRISPDSFFQINTPAANLLYSNALELADVTNRTTLLDLCSGIGAISIFASQEVRGSVGIEVLEEAVNDAKMNAQINNVANCHFIAGSVEKKLNKVLNDLKFSPKIVGILNPGRSGVPKKAIQVLRSCSTLRNLIYISCKADNRFTMNNFFDLMNPKFDDSPPFILTEVQPVDMFPHTNHCELIMVFKR